MKRLLDLTHGHRCRNHFLGMKEVAVIWGVLALMLACTTQGGELRTWTDSTGKFTREAEFVKLQDEQVHLKRKDGAVFAIPLARLSARDQDYARGLPKSDGHVDPFESQLPNDRSAGSTAVVADSSDVRIVVVSGAGTDQESAKKDAHREAVRQVVGALVDSETMTRNDQLVQDQVITLSSAFVQKSETLSTNSEQGIVRVRLKTVVKISPLIESLRENRISVRSIDSESLAAEQTTRLDQVQATLELLPKVFPNFRSTCFEAKAIGKPRLGQVSSEAADLGVTIQITPRHKPYSEMVKRLDDILRAKTRTSGEVVSDGQKPADGSTYASQLARFGERDWWLEDLLASEADKADFRSAWGNNAANRKWLLDPIFFMADPSAVEYGYSCGIGALPLKWQQLVDYEKGQRVAFFLLSCNETCSRTRWKWYVLSPEEATALYNAVPHSARIVTVLRDASSQEIARDEIRLNNLGFSSSHPFITAPFAMDVGHTFFRYTPKITLDRRLSLSEREIKAVASVEVFFEDNPTIQPAVE